MTKTIEQEYQRQLDLPVLLNNSYTPFTLQVYLEMSHHHPESIDKLESLENNETHRRQLALTRLRAESDCWIETISCGAFNRSKAIQEVADETEIGKILQEIVLATIKYAKLLGIQRQTL